jgi:hypothetical protein
MKMKRGSMGLIHLGKVVGSIKILVFPLANRVNHGES